VKNKSTVFHLVPAMQIGGVETAIFKSYFDLNEKIDYQVYSIFNKNSFSLETKSIWDFLWNILFNKPDLVITSLWVSHPFGWLCKSIGVNWVPFFHNSSFTHFRDRLVLIFTRFFCVDFIADSLTTLNFISRNRKGLGYVVPYIFRRNNEVDLTKKDIDLIWVGRNNIQKRLDLLCQFISEIQILNRNWVIKILIGGSNSNQVELLVNKFEKCDLEILYNKSNYQVLELLDRSKAYLLFSDFEGMSMTTIEAIQSLCFPVVRPVGEISLYLNKESSIFLGDVTSFQRILPQLNDIFENSQLRNQYCRKNLELLDKEHEYVTSLLTAIEKLV